MKFNIYLYLNNIYSFILTCILYNFHNICIISICLISQRSFFLDLVKREHCISHMYKFEKLYDLFLCIFLASHAAGKLLCFSLKVHQNGVCATGYHLYLNITHFSLSVSLYLLLYIMFFLR